MSIASRRATSPDTSSFDTRPLLESLGTPEAAISSNADSLFGDESLQPSSTPVKERPAGNGSPNSGVAGAKDFEEQLDAGEQRIWNEVKEIIATFG